MNFQQLLLAIQQYWAERRCVLQQPYDVEVGAGTMHPDTFFRVLGPEPWKVAYCQPSRRPVDGRFGENPMRVYKHYQFQVILKPAPLDVQEQYLGSLRAFGIDPLEHDIRFEEDNWESPTLGAAGVGWQVFLNDIRNIFDIPWNDELTYGDVRHAEEVEHSAYSFHGADVPLLRGQFDAWERESQRLLEPAAPDDDEQRPGPLVLPAYEAVLKCSHLFNVLDARGALSVTERATSIQRIRRLACRCADAYLAQREAKGFPLMTRQSDEQSQAG